MWDGNRLESDESLRVGLLNRTKTMIDGIWMISYYSPAAAARNQYGDDLYQRVEHWQYLAQNLDFTVIQICIFQWEMFNLKMCGFKEEKIEQ